MPRSTASASVRSGRGRARETYTRTVVADVTVHDLVVLRAAALCVLNGRTIVIVDEAAGAQDGLLDPHEEAAMSAAAALEWCVEPTARLWPLLEAGAVQIVAADLEIVAADLEVRKRPRGRRE